MMKICSCIYLSLTLLLESSGNTPSNTKAPFKLTETISSSVLKIISTNPSYVPEKKQLDDIKVFLAKLYKTENTEYVLTEAVEFVDQGGNFESVTCNLCGHNINIESWQNELDKASEKHFTDLIFITPCCKRKTSLNDLIYKSPAGFAKFVINISDPKKELTETELKKLQNIAGTKLRVVWAHY